MSCKLLLYLFCVLQAIHIGACQECESFPIIDLGYTRHAVTRTNVTASNITYATYANIRFAQPPVGELRFRRPQTPPPSNATIQDGRAERNATDCLQAIPADLPIAPGVNGTSWGTEDCLYLDVKVPEGLQGQKVPVLLWFFGGGFFFGSKEPWAGDPQGLFQQMSPDQKFIVVSSNYRLGGMGFLAPDVPGFDKNVAFYDALAALGWVHDYISYFGGDPEDITIIGESAGGGLGQVLLTAFGGGIEIPIKKVILTSPGHRPMVDRREDFNAQYNTMLNFAGCSDLACLHSLSSDRIAEVNRAMTNARNLSEGWIGPGVGYGAFTPDGDIMPDIPWRSLRAGNYQKQVRTVLTGGMLGDISPAVLPVTSWLETLLLFMKSPIQTAIDRVAPLYPGNVTIAAALFQGDVVFKCHSYFIANATSSRSYKYEMSIPPAIHGQDQFYYYYGNSTADSAVEFPEVALQMQEYFRGVILDGYAGGTACEQSRPHWPTYSSSAGSRWMNITSEGFQLVYGATEELQAQRCEAILELINDPANGW